MRGMLGAGVVVFSVACVAFASARSEPKPPFPKTKALTVALRNAPSGWTEAKTIPLDRAHWRVTFFDGPRELLDVAVDPRGRIDATEIHAKGMHPPGSRTLWSPALLALFTGLFVAAVAVRPLVSLRNLDALVVGVGFTAAALLIDARLVAAYVFAGALALLYVAVRCVMIAFSTRDDVRLQGLPLGTYLPMITIATLLAGVMLVLTSTGTYDVAFAGMAGGTLLNHGVSPYGHIPSEIVHGDTYPLLTYVLYMPFAAISPVHDSFDSLDGALWLNAIALVLAAALTRRWGTRAALAWLAFPPALLAASSGANDVPAAAFVVAALAFAARHELSTGLLALAGWVKIGPAAALVPMVARLRGANAARALAIVAALVAAGFAAMLAIGGTDAIDKATDALRFQFERGSWFSVWRQLDAPAVQVVLQATTVAFASVAAVAVWKRRITGFRQIVALAAAVVALVQLSANYWSYTYLPWLLPFILVALFPPVPPHSPPCARRAP